MFKRFYSSGVLVHPLVLLAMGAGAVFVYKFDMQTIMSIFMYYDYYLVVLTIAFLYTIFFEMAFKSRGHEVDWKVTFSRVVNGSVRMIIANMVSIAICYLIEIWYYM